MTHRQRWHGTIAILTAAILGAAGCTPREPAKLPASVAEAQVRAASAEWDAAHNLGNVDALMTLYADSAISMPPGRPALVGKPAIESDFREFFAGFDANHQTTVMELVVSGEWAIERGRYEFAATPKAGGAMMAESGKHVVIRHHTNDGWKVRWEIWNTDSTR